MKRLTRYLADQILAFFQKRCEHPGDMVAADILEGTEGPVVAYCRRCGSVRLTVHGKEYNWRRPDPNLWRGR